MFSRTFASGSYRDQTEFSSTGGSFWAGTHGVTRMTAPKDESLLASEKGDLYHHGIITKLFPSNNTGIVRTENGRELPFSYEFVILSGEAKTVQDLREGDRVGYDLGWTSNGLRVTKIKTYPRNPPDTDLSR